MMADRVIFVCTLILAGVYFYATENLPSLEIGDPLGPKAFPRLLGIALVATAIFHLLEILRARKNPSALAATKKDPVDRISYMVVGGVSVWTLLFFVFFEQLGYMIAGSIYLVVLMNIFNKGRWVMNVVTAVLFSIGSYLLFTKGFGVNLARGLLPF
jgi:putative tricarboxylic transport membrane protein